LRYFPGRTETDLYVWLLLNQAELRNELGWEFRPVELVKLAEQYHPRPTSRGSILLDHLLSRTTPEAEPGRVGPVSWSGDITGQQHAHALFPSVLVAAEPGEQAWTGLDQALLVAGAERSRLFGLCVVADPASGDAQALAETFSQRCRDAGVEGRLGMEAGSLSDRISQRGLLVDLVVVNCGLGGQPEHRQAFTSEIGEVLQRCARPVLVVPGMATPCRRVLVALDNHTRAREALVVATYMARRWEADLHVLVVTERGDPGQEVTANARQYLDQHGVVSGISTCDGDAAQTILHIARTQERDLIVMGSYSGGWLRQRLRGNVVNRVLEQAALPVLVCP
jgi:nucleotide-binding universal stress UspA family protein